MNKLTNKLTKKKKEIVEINKEKKELFSWRGR